MQHWEYSAPMYGDLVALSPPRDSFFAMSEQIDLNFVNIKNLNIKQEMTTPVTAPAKSIVNDHCKVPIKKEFVTPSARALRRRSRSVNAILQTTKHITEELDKIVDDLNCVQISKNGKQEDRVNDRLKHKFIKKSMSVTSLNGNASKRFISTAEAIYHLQKDTPERFHTQSNKNGNKLLNFSKQKFQQLQSTIPHSPALISKMRNRPITALSRKEMEDIVVEDMKKHKIRAHPVSQAVLQGIPINVPVDRKPVTKPEPFNLTEMKKKTVTKSPEKVFHARPAPKHILEKHIEIPKRLIPCTIPKSPNITKIKKGNHNDKFTSGIKTANHMNNVLFKIENINIQDGVGHSGVPLSKKVIPQSCKPIPFSFEEKDKERQLKKMEKIKRVLEEEKKMREFHAKPLPSTILKKSNPSSSSSLNKSFPIENKKGNKENKPDNKQGTVFKARPATVLSKKPFIPTHAPKFSTKIEPIRLTTEQRSKERQMYDMQIKLKEEQLEVERKIHEEQERLKKEQEILVLRSRLVHKAAPVRHYQPISIQPSAIPPTVAKSPNFTHK